MIKLLEIITCHQCYCFIEGRCYHPDFKRPDNIVDKSTAIDRDCPLPKKV